MRVKHRICTVYGLYQLRLWRASSWCNFDNVCKTFASSCLGMAQWRLRFLMHSSYSVISDLNAFQAANVLRSIKYLWLTVYVFGG